MCKDNYVVILKLINCKYGIACTGIEPIALGWPQHKHM